MIGIVLAHGKAQNVFDAYVDNWRLYFEEIHVVCPEDDSIESSFKTHKVGYSQHHGFWTCERHRYSYELASTFESACVFEYDTLFFAPPKNPQKGAVLGCGPMYDYNKSFSSTWFMHSPWIMHKDDYAEACKFNADFKNTQYSDRWSSEVCDNLRVVPMPIGNHYTPSCGTICNNDEYVNALLKAKEKDLCVIHGIKDLHLALNIFLIREKLYLHPIPSGL